MSRWRAASGQMPHANCVPCIASLVCDMCRLDLSLTHTHTEEGGASSPSARASTQNSPNRTPPPHSICSAAVGSLRYERSSDSSSQSVNRRSTVRLRTMASFAATSPARSNHYRWPLASPQCDEHCCNVRKCDRHSSVKPCQEGNIRALLAANTLTDCFMSSCGIGAPVLKPQGLRHIERDRKDNERGRERYREKGRNRAKNRTSCHDEGPL